jgi:hypothetical protein
MTDDVPPLLVLQARAEARAILYAAGEYQCIEDAVAPLLDDAIAAGLTDQTGADVAYAIAQPFTDHPQWS